MKRIYYRIVYKLESPLSVGSGTNDNSDMDILRDGRGIPYIPATSIAGVLRHGFNDPEKEKELFGSINSDQSEEYRSSPVIIYNAELILEKTVSIRDSVELDNNKCGVDSAKFDFEIVETGAEFMGYIELTEKASGSEAVIEGLLARLNSGELRFGRKTTRGFGQVSLKVRKRSFSDVDKWLDFDMFREEDWKESCDISLNETDSGMTHIKLSLEMKGGISIREYTTELPEEAVDDKAPDYKSLTLHSTGVPVIPGTSWAGAFRARFAEFAGEEKKKELFGYVVKNTKTTHKSRITFNESRIENAKSKLITRNSIDRFSAGTNDGALYTELTYFGGSTELDITLPSDMYKEYILPLNAVIADLHNGFLSVGGLTAVGRGLFEVTGYEINGNNRYSEFIEFAEKGGAVNGLYQ